jgi:hypothetical protein
MGLLRVKKAGEKGEGLGEFFLLALGEGGGKVVPASVNGALGGDWRGVIAQGGDVGDGAGGVVRDEGHFKTPYC